MSLTHPSLRLRAPKEARQTRARESIERDDKTQPLDSSKKPLEAEECDVQIPTASRDASFWISLCLVVAPVYLITPFSWAYALYVTHRLLIRDTSPGSETTSLKPWELILFLYTTFEVLFSVYYQSLAARARRYESKIPQRDIHELQLIFTRVLQSGLAPPLSPTAHSRPQSPAELITSLPYSDPRAADFRQHFRLWFWGAPWKTITRQSLSRWLSWSVFDRSLDTLDHVQKVVIEEATIMLEKRAGGRMREEPEEGKDHIAPITPTWDPVNIWSRPGILYVVGDLLNRATKLYLEWSHGMVLKEFEGLEYLIRSPDHSGCSAPAQSPLVFMHGLGFGLAQYLFSVLLLLKHSPATQPILIPLQPHISNAILHPFHVNPMSRDGLVLTLRNLFQKLRWDEEGVTMISHSKGSAAHTWMLKAYPELVKRSCFIDPVCFCLWEGDLCWNFVYRRPSNAVELIMKYFAGTEPGIALSVQRHFDWVANSLWFEEIPRARNPYYTTFFVGGEDAVIDGWRVRRYLLNHGIRDGLHWDPEGRHGQPVLNGRGLKQLEDWLVMPEPEAIDLDSNSNSSDDDEPIEVEQTVLNADVL